MPSAMKYMHKNVSIWNDQRVRDGTKIDGFCTVYLLPVALNAMRLSEKKTILWLAIYLTSSQLFTYPFCAKNVQPFSLLFAFLP